MMEVFTVDAFTDRPFGGNPAAVCIIRERHAGEMSEEKMQAIAAEMNLSETAFVSPDGDSTFEGGAHFKLRWFTPTCEVPLCGHATLATAAILFNELGNTNNLIDFKTLSGLLKASRSGEYITLDFPLAPCAPEDVTPLQELLKHTIGDLPFSDIQYSSIREKLLVRLSNSVGRRKLEHLKPNTGGMLQAPNQGTGKVKGVIVTVKGSDGYDFFSRYFAPWVGIPEDPVTGSAHTVLASYWSQQLGKKEMVAMQCSPRGGELRVTVGEAGRVYLAGKACIVVKGHLHV